MTLRTTLIASSVGCLIAIVFSLNALAQDPKPANPLAEKYLINSLDGYALYQNYCATCHGPEGKGNGPTAGALKTSPSDLTQIARRNGGMFPSKMIEKIISGESEMVPHGTREMPLWGPIFSQIAWDQDLGRVRVANLTKYLESIQMKSGIGDTQRR